MNIIELYEDLKKYIEVEDEIDEMFCEAPEGEVQIDIVKDMLEEILKKL